MDEAWWLGLRPVGLARTLNRGDCCPAYPLPHDKASVFRFLSGKAGIPFILIAVLLDVLSLGVVIPVLAKLIKELLNDNTADAAAYVGWFGTVWAFMQFFSSPLMGALSDRFGRRPVLLISAFGLGIDYILMALAPNLIWLFIGRILTGITAASFSTASAYIADVTPPENRSAAFGIFGAAFGLGFILGPALGGYLGDIDLRLPFWVSAALTLANATYGFFILPESLPPEKRSPFRWSRANPLGSLQLLRSQSGLLAMAVILFCYQLAHHVFSSVFVLYTDERFHWDAKMVGFALSTVGILNFIVQGLLIRPAVRAFGERAMVFAGLLGGIAGFTAYAWVDNGRAFYLSTIIFATMGFFNASIQGLMSKRIEPNQQGQLSGANSSLNGIAGMIGPTLFATVFQQTIDPKSPWHWPGAPFALAAAILGVGFFLATLTISSVGKRPTGTDNPKENRA
ncbi:MAG: TCR/Tet family MFS transporter [Planctomycetota bacterium]|jgi:DHA1 family tetracycline resistance protein-like MFS transporter